MQDKICLITGANGGLGKAIATAFAKKGATVIMLCRDRTRGLAAQSEVQTASSNPNVELLVADLGSQASVRGAVARFKEHHTRLDVLVNNAAVYKNTRTLTADGFETMFSTNHLGHFLLTNLLLDSLKAAPSARVITVSAPTTTPLDFDDLNGEKKFSAFNAFGASKMCNLLFAFELARRLDGTKITSNAVHPGLVKSNLMSEAMFIIRFMTNLISTSPEKAAQAFVYLAGSPEVAGVSGKFFKGTKVSAAPAYSLDTDAQRRLWDISSQSVGLAQPAT
jgi:NAD(P)-dependent dehydrogenase (short-subunit alcohol dehydrogenase family)